ncbi:MAG: multidrug ABC transporter permease [Syntrophus sp. (in: bacteria)]|nr:multidrug ABC transporter permease [Syntrophus sp. (in: bacteria)]
MKVIYVLWLRQLKRYFRSRARIVGSLGQPLLFLLALGFGFGPIYTKAGGGNYIQFLAPGIIAMSILFTATFSGIEVLWDKQFGFLKEILVAPVSRLQIMVGRTLGGATVAVFQGTIVFFLSLIFGFRPTDLTLLPLALIFMVLIAVIFTALGTAIASFIEDMQGFQLIINFVIMPTFFLSGALFPIEGLPKTVAVVSSMNPLTYGVDALRGILISSARFGLITDLAVLLCVAAVIMAAGSYLFSRIQI